MPTIKTTKCSARNHPELTLAFDAGKVLEQDVRWFASSLERDVDSGTRFEVGQSMQIGWMWVWFVALPDGTYGLEEPDMKTGTPLTRQPGLTNSLGHLRFQKDTLESVLPATSLSFPSIQQTCLVCTRLAKDGAFFLDRREPTDKDSGWIFGCESDHDHQTAASWQKSWLYTTVVDNCRRALPYLAFPPGSLITVTPQDVPAFFLNEKQLPIRKGSYVQRLIEGQQLNKQ